MGEFSVDHTVWDPFATRDQARRQSVPVTKYCIKSTQHKSERKVDLRFSTDQCAGMATPPHASLDCSTYCTVPHTFFQYPAPAFIAPSAVWCRFSPCSSLQAQLFPPLFLLNYHIQ